MVCRKYRKMLDVMNLREYAEFRNDWAAETAGETPDPLFADPSLLGEGTNWQKEIFQTAPIMNHQLSFSGGDKTRYLFRVVILSRTVLSSDHHSIVIPYALMWTRK